MRPIKNPDRILYRTHQRFLGYINACMSGASHLLINERRVNVALLKNTDTNFDIDERVRRSIFIDRRGDWTITTNGVASAAEYPRAFTPEFLIFVEIYDLDGELISNCPVEHCAESDSGAAKRNLRAMSTF